MAERSSSSSSSGGSGSLDEDAFVKLDHYEQYSNGRESNTRDDIVDDDDDTNQLSRRMTVHIADKSALLCKNGCGFYGNREWDGFCSLCYKQIRIHGTHGMQSSYSSSSPAASAAVASIETSAHRLSAQPPRSSPILVKNRIIPEGHKRAQSTSAVPQLSSSPTSILSNASGPLSFRKFEEKKRQQSDKKKSIKSNFKKAFTFREYRSSSSNNASGSSDNSWPFFSLKKGIPFDEMLGKFFRDDIVSDIDANVSKCVDRMNKMLQRGMSIDELTECIDEFYNTMKNRFQTHPNYRDIPNEQFDQLVDQTEKMLMDKLYASLFARVQSEEEERDLELQKKIRNLNWIMPSHLDIDLNLRHPKVKDLLDKAITEIIELDSRQVPFEKLESVVKCSETIFQMLKVNNNKAISADHFLPALVFVIIKANPPLLQSNIKYISRFSTPFRLMSGEAGYYFTNLCCATSFVEKICGKSLNMNENDFESYMNGEAQPPGYYKQSFLCEAFRIMSTNYSMLSDTRDRNASLESKIDLLSQKIQRFTERFETRCTSAINTSKATIKQCSQYELFEHDFDSSHLPTHFRKLYLQYQEHMSNRQSAKLIDIDDTESAALTIAPSAAAVAEPLKICDTLENMELNYSESGPEASSGSAVNEKPISILNTNEEDIKSKLPPPLSPQVVLQP